MTGTINYNVYEIDFTIISFPAWNVNISLLFFSHEKANFYDLTLEKPARK
jgi:hypothetical protein